MIGSAALAAMFVAASAVMMPQTAFADDAVIWGRQTGLGEFITEKVNLTAPATITAVTYEGAGPGYCIWSGANRYRAILCWDVGDPSLVGTVLPVERGYFAIPAKRTSTTPAYVQITVAY